MCLFDWLIDWLSRFWSIDWFVFRLILPSVDRLIDWLIADFFLPGFYRYRKLPKRDAVATTLYFTGLRVAAQGLAVGVIMTGAAHAVWKDYTYKRDHNGAPRPREWRQCRYVSALSHLEWYQIIFSFWRRIANDCFLLYSFHLFICSGL